jgi:hypothetical protein
MTDKQKIEEAYAAIQSIYHHHHHINGKTRETKEEEKEKDEIHVFLLLRQWKTKLE